MVTGIGIYSERSRRIGSHFTVASSRKRAVRSGRPVRTQTANGSARAWLVRIDELRVGDLVLHGVDAAVHEGELPFVLLGMSALNRMEISRESSVLTLKQRY